MKKSIGSGEEESDQELIEEKPSDKKESVKIKGNNNKPTDIDKSILEILVEKIDNRKVPLQGKYDESSGESLTDYLDRFEDYCKDNIRGGNRFWIDELEGKLMGDTLKAFYAIKDVGDSYDSLKSKLLTWFNGMKDMRKKKAKAQFEKATYNSKESLYLYSTRLEKLFRRAYPFGKVSKSSTWRDKYMSTVPYQVKKALSQHMFSDKLNDKSTTWESIQKFARHRDVWVGAKKSDSESDEKDETPNEIVISVWENSKIKRTVL